MPAAARPPSFPLPPTAPGARAVVRPPSRRHALRVLMAGPATLAAGPRAAVAADGDVRVAVASNFAPTLARLAAAFAAATGRRVTASAASTGRLRTQIEQGAPFDVLLAADDDTPRRLVVGGHAVAGSAFAYAVGELVLWSARPGFVDAAGAVLDGGAFERLALAQPRLAPYGRAAEQTLRARGLLERLRPKLVLAESVAQAAQYVAGGHAELGFVARAQRVRPAPGAPVGSQWRVPATMHDPILQGAVLLRTARDPAAAQAWLAWLRGAAARRLIEADGYRLP